MLSWLRRRTSVSIGSDLSFETPDCFDQIADLSARSFNLLLSSLHRSCAQEDGQSKVKGGLPHS